MKPSPSLLFRLLLTAAILSQATAAPPPTAYAQSGGTTTYLPIVTRNYRGPVQDWPQLGHDAQRTNATPEQVDPPYCIAWKWNAVPIASRAQPVVAGGRLFIGGMDGVLYARDATNGAPLWAFPTGGPIRDSAGVAGNRVIFSSYDGFTYALDVASGALAWKVQSGSSATAPLIDMARGRAYVASTNGTLTALSLANGSPAWSFASGAAILTSPALSQDGKLVLFGNEAIQAIALDAASGKQAWRVALQGQSLANRYPVVAGDAVFYRSQPLYFFHSLLHEGDSVLDSAGTRLADWNADWSIVKPKILSYLQGNNPTGQSLSTLQANQTFFALNAATGATRGIAPMLYTFGSNGIPAAPVIANGAAYVAYRARHGIQTDGGAVHVSSEYDAELGRMDLSTLDISGLRSSNPYTGQFRMTSDEPSVLSMGGSILWVDNWERLGNLNVSTGQLSYAANVSNNWPACDAQCGLDNGKNPFFPLSGNPNDPAYPFPGPQVTEGSGRGGIVLANGMVYWRVVAAGLAGITHMDGKSCPSPKVYTDAAVKLAQTDAGSQPTAPEAVTALEDYVKVDRTTPVPVTPQNQDLIDRLNAEVQALLKAANGQHLMPYFLERGFSSTVVWPYTLRNGILAAIDYTSQGTAFWFDPGELLYTLAMAYPYLTPANQTALKSYLSAEMARYSPLQDLPYNNAQRDWLRSGSARELYSVPFRSKLNNWPTVGVNLQALYGLWLWSKNTNDYSYAQANWTQVQNLYNAKSGSIRYYADIAGIIGYYRLALHLGKTSEANSALNTAVSALQNSLNFNSFVSRANGDYPDPRGVTSGWSAPVFFGMTPEIGAFLAEQTGGQAGGLLRSLESLNSANVGLLWWYLTRAGEHAEVGETDYLSPFTAWSHFLGHAYILRDNQAALRHYLDRPWTPGDLYSIQKVVATIQAQP